jgi:hypothetical protein
VSDRLDDPRPDDALQTAARAVARSTRLAVFTGAGVSKESGIATFREPETGLWARYDPMQLATPEAYEADPAFVWSWYEHRFGVAAEAEPNPGHFAIAELEQVLPRVVVITQNIDGLHQRAGSSRVIELHGTMHSFRCVEGRHRGFAWSDFSDQKEKPPRRLRRDAHRRHVGRGLPRRGHADDRPGGRSHRDRREPAAGRAHSGGRRDVFLQGPGGEVLPALAAAVREHLAD